MYYLSKFKNREDFYKFVSKRIKQMRLLMRYGQKLRLRKQRHERLLRELPLGKQNLTRKAIPERVLVKIQTMQSIIVKSQENIQILGKDRYYQKGK